MCGIRSWIAQASSKRCEPISRHSGSRSDQSFGWQMLPLDINGFGTLREIGGKLVHEDATGKLWRTSTDRITNGRRMVSPNGESDIVDDIAVVEVVNGSLEPDGSRKSYHLSVPPTCQTATEAVAWTYGLSAKEYEGLQVRT